MKVTINRETALAIEEQIGEHETINNFLRRLLGLKTDAYKREKKYDNNYMLSLKDDVVTALEDRYEMMSLHKAIRVILGLAIVRKPGGKSYDSKIVTIIPYEQLRTLKVDDYARIRIKEQMYDGRVVDVRFVMPRGAMRHCLEDVKKNVKAKEAEYGRKFELVLRRSRLVIDVFCSEIFNEPELL